MTGMEEAIAQLREENLHLRRRLEVLERVAALTLQSSASSWHPDTGLDLSRYGQSEVSAMIMGRIPWDPQALDKGG